MSALFAHTPLRRAPPPSIVRGFLPAHSVHIANRPLIPPPCPAILLWNSVQRFFAQRKQQSGAKPPEAVEREAVDVLVGMLRKLGGDQVISGATTPYTLCPTRLRIVAAAVSLSQIVSSWVEGMVG